MDVTSPPRITVDRAGVAEETDCREDVDLPTDDHLMNLKALAEKLRLETRRPSYLEWKARLEAKRPREKGAGQGPTQMEHEGRPDTRQDTVVDSEVAGCRPPSGALGGFGTIDDALGWLRRELVRR